MGAADAGMKKASASATKNLDKINKLLDDQVDVIKDLKKAFGDASDEMEDFGNESEKSTKKAGKRFSKLSGGVKKAMKSIQNRVMQFNVANIAQNMKTLTGESGNLTNSLEATMTSMMQTTKPIAAELNLSSNEMKKFAGRAAGMAYGMNTSADAVARTMKSIHLANKGAKAALDEMGMSTKDWVKVVQTTNVPMQDYTAILGDMTTSWGASPKEAAKMLDNLMAIGKVAGTGTGAIKNAKVQLDELGEVFKDLPPSMARSSKEIMSLMESSARMSGVFRQMGDTQEEAISKANTVAKMFAEQAVHVEKALAIGDERALADNPLIKFLTQLGIGFDEARDIVLTGSKDTVKGMQKINELYARFGDNASPQVQRALSGLSGALGEGAAGLSYLAQNTTKGTAALSEMARVSVNGSGALKQFGKDAYSSGLTLQDTYDRATLAFDTTIRSIARTQVKGLVKKQISGMREAGNELRSLGSDKTWGPWINMLSQFKQMGMSGLFSSLAQSTGVGAKGASKFGAKFGLITGTMKQLGEELGPVMRLVGMFGPLGVLGAGAVGISSLFAMDSGDRKKMLSSFVELFGKLKVGFSKVLGYLKIGFKTLVDSGVVSDIVEGLSKAFGYVIDIFPWQKFLEGVTFVVSKLATALSKLDWAPIIKGIVGSIKDVVGSILDGIGEAFGTGGQIAAGFIGVASLGGSSFISPIAQAMGPGGIIMGAAIGIAGAMIFKLKKGLDDLREYQKKMITYEGGEGVAKKKGKELWSKKMEEVDKRIMEKYAEKFKISVDSLIEEGITAKDISEKGGKYFDPEMFGIRQGILGQQRIRKEQMSNKLLSIAQWTTGANAIRGFAEVNIEKDWQKDVSKGKTAGILDFLAGRRGDEERAAKMRRITEGMIAKGEVSAAQKEFSLNVEKLLQVKDAQPALEKAFSIAKTNKDRVALLQTMIEKYSTQISQLEDASLLGMEGSTEEAGLMMGEATGKGYAEGVKIAAEMAKEAQEQYLAPVIGQSLPTEGPLKDGIGAFGGGYETMISFADGITSGTDMVRIATENALDESVILSLDTYATKMRELASQRTFLADVAKSMVKDLTGVQIESDDYEANVDVKKSFKTAMSLPGLASVVLAVTNEGASTRKMLKKILEENVRTTSAILGKKSPIGSTSSSGMVPV